jgi:hypothetical protein
MNKSDRQYRFSEIMSAISMLPSIDMADDSSEGAEDWVLPYLTKGVSDSKLRDAILCQAMREDEEFKFKLVATLSNSAKASIKQKFEADEKPDSDDMEALGISANILWSLNQDVALYGLLGMLGTICAQFDVELPPISTAFLRGAGGIHNFGKLDPIKILSDEISPLDMRNALYEKD